MKHEHRLVGALWAYFQRFIKGYSASLDGSDMVVGFGDGIKKRAGKSTQYEKLNGTQYGWRSSLMRMAESDLWMQTGSV